MNNVDMKTIILFAVVALVASALSMLIMGAATLISLAPTAIIVGAMLTAVIVTAIMIIIMVAGYGVRSAQPATSETASSSADFSVTDPLTRTMNRRGITIGIMDAMALGERYGNPLSVAKLDLDALAKVNEKYGQEAGDRLLAGVAAVLADALRMPDKIGRFDEDEFILVMPQTRIDDAFMISDRLRALIEKQKFSVDGETASITISAGVTEYQPGDDLESLFSRIQKGVDQSRESGRNTVTKI
ncbi:MAG: GGDEF domain-containing protein [Acidiferrobacterales bacterium]|jgi:diguanylate cyclase (GGDEF)-like protein|nr:GGDEF domain-containing protein [Acidiferrobacterales bacterium]